MQTRDRSAEFDYSYGYAEEGSRVVGRWSKDSEGSCYERTFAGATKLKGRYRPHPGNAPDSQVSDL
jgi:hypothetical protein